MLNVITWLIAGVINLAGWAMGNALGFVLGTSYCVLVIAPALAVTMPIAATAAITSLLSVGWVVAAPPVGLILGLLASVIARFAAVSATPWLLALVVILTVHAVATVLLYGLAVRGLAAANAVAAPTAGPVIDNIQQGVARSSLNGLCAGVNLSVLLMVSLPAVAAVSAGGSGLAAGILAVSPFLIWLVTALAALPVISTSTFYHGFLGWFAWLSPMAWPATVFGLIIMLANALARTMNVPTVTIPGLGTLNAARRPMRFDWRTATIVNHGGFFTYLSSAYNCGNVVFVNYNVTDFPDSNSGITVQMLLWHETGHTLDIGAFGWLYGVADSIETRFFPPAGPGSAYGERTAESHLRNGVPGPNARPYVAIWGATMNTLPVAAISAPPTGTIGTAVALAGAFSDAETIAGTFWWKLKQKPNGSTVSDFVAPSRYAAGPSLTPDVPGTYTIGLVVNDGKQNSPETTISIVVA